MKADANKHLFSGMNRDTAIDKVESRYYYDAKNIRVTTTESGTQLAVTNERGNKLLTLTGQSTILGKCIGHAVINNTVVLFTVDGSTSRIYKVVIAGTTNTATKLFEGSLGFSADHKIETLVSYENESVQKVYWVDSINQPRVINIASTNISSTDTTQFDFCRELMLGETVSITRIDGGGVFMPGTIQYFLSYFNEYGQESSIFYQSQLLYTSEPNNGGEPNKTVSNSFQIQITNVDSKWDYVRLYSIMRTSTDTTPTARVVGEVKASSGATSVYKSIRSSGASSIPNLSASSTPSSDELLGTWSSLQSDTDYQWYEAQSGCSVKVFEPNSTNYYTIDAPNGTRVRRATPITIGLWYFVNTTSETINVIFHNQEQQSIVIVDNNVNGESIDPSVLMFLGAENIAASTIEQKDNVLFLGDLTLNQSLFSDTVKNAFKNQSITESTVTKPYTTSLSSDEYYKYETQLKFPTASTPKSTSCFKWNETYRFGVQFQDKYGKWSQPLFINDKKITECPVVNPSDAASNPNTIEVSLPQFTLTQQLLNTISSYNFVKMRPVVVLPSYNEREVICQGVVCPTVYNVLNRINNAPFAQPSWFFRPINANSYYVCTADASVEHKCTWGGYYNCSSDASKKVGSSVEFRNGGRIPGGSSLRAEIMTSGDDLYYGTDLSRIDSGYYTFPKIDSTDYQEFLNDNKNEYFVDTSIITLNSPDIEFDDQILLNDISSYNFRLVGALDIAANTGDITMITSAAPHAGNTVYGFKKHIVRSKNSTKILTNGAYYFDKVFPTSSTVVNSKMGYIMYPFGKSTQLSDCTDSSVDYGSIQTKLISNFRYSAVSKYTNSYKTIPIADANVFDTGSKSWGNISYAGKSVTYSPTEYECMHTKTMWNLFSFAGALNASDVNNIIDNPVESSDLNAIPAIVIYKAELEPSSSSTGSTITVQYIGEAGLNQDNISLIRLPDGDCSKSGMSINIVSKTYSVQPHSSITDAYIYTFTIKYKNGGSHVAKQWMDMLVCISYNTASIENIYGTNYTDTPAGTYNAVENVFTPYVKKQPAITVSAGVYSGSGSSYTSETYGSITNPSLYNFSIIRYPRLIQSSCSEADSLFSVVVPVQYKSTRHAVISFDRYISNNKKIQYALPENIDGLVQHLFNLDSTDNNNRMFFDYDKTMIDSFEYHTSFNPFGSSYRKNILLIGELYREVQDKFGGTSDYAIENNNWVVAGKSVDVAADAVIEYTEGDTYFQRYDCLKTVPRNYDDVNQIIDICSFMVETRINIDGRFDKHRNVDDILSITEDNFNKLNSAYTQTDNFFTYNILSDRFSNTSFPNQITWTQRKVLGAKTDNWCNVTLANTLDLDGDKGHLTILERFNNDIWFFQEHGFGKIGFNENVQINSSNGTPIELANSGTVSGKVYANESIGCQDKWSVLSTQGGIYFADNANKAIVKMSSEGTQMLTTVKGFESWAKVSDLDSIITSYDSINHDVYFRLGDESLCFNETANEFVSFYDYNDEAMFNVAGRFLSIHHIAATSESSAHSDMYAAHEGRYNQFYGTYQPYYVEFIENKDPEVDKVFTNLEYRSDMYGYNEDTDKYDKLFPQTVGNYENTDTFNQVITSNEYQSVTDEPAQSQFSSTQKKFRTWRVQIGRAYIDAQNAAVDRIRNQWCKFKFKRLMSSGTAADDLNDRKHLLYDAVVKFYK